MTMRLYYAPGSCALAPLLLLEEMGLPYALHRLDLGAGDQAREPFLALNPMGRVPVLVDGDFVLTENVAILHHLAAGHGDRRLWPQDQRAAARCLEWLAWGAAALHPAMAHVRRPERYAAGPSAHTEVTVRGRATVRSLFAQAEERLARYPWAAGEALSVADLYLLFFWIWGPRLMEEPEPRRRFPRWADLADRLTSRPAVARIIDREAIAVP